MQYSAECIILAPPFECNFQISNLLIYTVYVYLELHPEKIGFRLDSIHSALARERAPPHGQRRGTATRSETVVTRVPIHFLLDILCY